MQRQVGGTLKETDPMFYLSQSNDEKTAIQCSNEKKMFCNSTQRHFYKLYSTLNYKNAGIISNVRTVEQYLGFLTNKETKNS